MKDIVSLNRLILTGPIHINTPLIVITEIADAQGLIYDSSQLSNESYLAKMITYLQKMEKPIVHSLSPTRDELSQIAAFINRGVNWPFLKLKMAWKFILPFLDCPADLTVESLCLPYNYKFGLQTPTEPNSFNACLLYRLCVDNGISLNRDTSLSKMAFYIQYSQFDKHTLSHIAVYHLDRYSTTNELINIIDRFRDDAGKDIEQPIDHAILKSTYLSLMENNVISKRIRPSNKLEAIALSALQFEIDITGRANDAIMEYYSLRKFGRDWYIKQQISDEHQRFDLQRNFNPLFPQEYYPNDTLRNLAYSEGYTHLHRDTSYYEYLQIAYLSETFYEGLQAEITVDETPILMEKITDLRREEVLCYGRKGSCMRPITYQEIIDLFTVNNSFVNPFDNNYLFPREAINKLKYICRDKPDSIHKLSLSKIITQIEQLNKNLGTRVTYFISIYNTLGEKTRCLLEKALHQLIDTAMYMRGWKGPDFEFPLEGSNLAADQIDINVNSSLREFKMTIQTLGDIGSNFLDLPLLKYVDDKFIPSTNIESGYTIGERIMIVMKGSLEDNMSSCIRLSSNWLAASGYQYTVLIGKSPPFNIKLLRFIS